MSFKAKHSNQKKESSGDVCQLKAYLQKLAPI